MARTNASKVRTLIEKPIAAITGIAAASDTGTASIGISVAPQARRNTRMTMATRMMASTRVETTAWIEARMKSDSS